MLCSIDTFDLADGTYSGGVALSNFRIRFERIFDVVIPIGQPDPVLYFRNQRKLDTTFSVTRSHATAKAAETYCLDHDATIPDSGPVKLTTTQGTLLYIFNGRLVNHALSNQTGSMTTHEYHIVGAPVTASPFAFAILLETLPPDGGYIRTESGDLILLE